MKKQNLKELFAEMQKLYGNKFAATVLDEESGKKYFLQGDTALLCSILEEHGVIESYHNGYVDFSVHGEVKTWTFSDFFDSLWEQNQSEVICQLFLEQMAMEFPKQPISIDDFLALNSVQQQNYIDYAVVTPYMRYQWIYDFGQFVRGRTILFNPAWGVEMFNLSKLFYWCLDGETLKLNILKGIEAEIEKCVEF